MEIFKIINLFPNPIFQLNHKFQIPYIYLKKISSGGMGILSFGPSVKVCKTSWLMNWPKPMLSRERSCWVKSVRRVRVFESRRAVGRYAWFGYDFPSILKRFIAVFLVGKFIFSKKYRKIWGLFFLIWLRVIFIC